MDLPFAKYVGCGNDFIIIDNRQNQFMPDSSVFSNMCHRQKGIGADGVLLLENSTVANYRMRIFNSDGSEAEMCGNGLRCLAKYIHTLDRAQDCFTIQTMQQTTAVRLNGHSIEVKVPPPLHFEQPKTLQIESKTFTLHCLDTGVPHAVIFFDKIHDALFESHASKIRFHPFFSPKGTNVNFVQTTSESSLSIRTYERGVEKETLSCGTGAIAAALVAAKFSFLQSPIRVDTRSSESLVIFFEYKQQKFANIRLSGPAKKVYSGIYFY